MLSLVINDLLHASRGNHHESLRSGGCTDALPLFATWSASTLRNHSALPPKGYRLLQFEPIDSHGCGRSGTAK